MKILPILNYYAFIFGERRGRFHFVFPIRFPADVKTQAAVECHCLFSFNTVNRTGFPCA